MDKEKKKNNIKLLVGAIILTLVVVLGTTYAWLRITRNSNVINKIKAGSLEMILDDSTTDGIKLINEVPKSYRQGMETKEYTFTLTNTGTTNNNYSIYLDDVLTFTNDENQEVTITDDNKLADTKIRYILLKDDEVAAASKSKLLSNTIERSIAGGKITSKQRIKYSLRIWIDSKAGDNNTQDEVMGKLFNAKLRVEASQATEKEDVKVSFSDDSWETIYNNVKAGKGELYNVGDTKILLNNWEVRLVNTTPCSKMNLDEYSESACGFVVEFQTPLGEYKMNNTATNVGGWTNSYARGTLSSFYSYLQTELNDYVADTKVISSSGLSDIENGADFLTSTDKLYILSPIEVFGSMPTGYNDFSLSYTRQLDYYEKIGVNIENTSGAIKYKDNNPVSWWFRTAMATNSYAFYVLFEDTFSNDGANSNLRYIFPVFRIG